MNWHVFIGSIGPLIMGIGIGITMESLCQWRASRRNCVRPLRHTRLILGARDGEILEILYSLDIEADELYRRAQDRIAKAYFRAKGQ
jgi:hypothetical protein